MTTDDCAKMAFLLQADFDGELGAGDAASLAAHLAECGDCRARQAAMSDLSLRLRTEMPRYAAPAGLRQAIEAAAARSAPACPSPVPVPRPAERPTRRPILHRWRGLTEAWARRTVPFGAGAVFAALVAFALLPGGSDMADSVVASHIRALQPGHLMDVVSTDQHTVKPWFDGRLDYAPPVKDLARQGFPLTGGRLDYLAGRPVAAMTYRRGGHIIDLYAWPMSSHIDLPRKSGDRSGYNFIRWDQDDMAFWVVSDLEMTELSAFVEKWRAAS